MASLCSGSLQNQDHLQAALGELAYKSEAAERLRLDIRSQAAKLREAEVRFHSMKQALEASEASQQALEQRLTTAAQQAERQRDLEQRLSVRNLLPGGFIHMRSDTRPQMWINMQTKGRPYSEESGW